MRRRRVVRLAGMKFAMELLDHNDGDEFVVLPSIGGFWRSNGHISHVTHSFRIPLNYFAAAASNISRNCSFFSAGKNEASNEFRANSRKCSSVKPKVSCAN